MIWASTWYFGSCRIGEQRRLRLDCAYAQSCQSFRCSHKQSMKVEEGSDQNKTWDLLHFPLVLMNRLNKTESAVF